MKKIIIPIMLISALFMGCEDENEAKNGVHKQGQDCLVCHGIGGSEDPTLSSGATVFTKLNALNSDSSSYAKGYTIRLLLSDGKTANYSSGLGDANSKTSAALGGYDFTAQVVNSSGKVVNSSATNSHNSNRLACNSCHTSRGVNNAPGRIINTKIQTNSDTPKQDNTSKDKNTSNTTNNNTTSTRSFKDDVMPVLESSCKGCHNPSGKAQGTKFLVTTVQETHTKVTAGNMLNLNAPANSWLLEKADGTQSHVGGVVLGKSSSNHKTIVEWITQGAKNN